MLGALARAADAEGPRPAGMTDDQEFLKKGYQTLRTLNNAVRERLHGE